MMKNYKKLKRYYCHIILYTKCYLKPLKRRGKNPFKTNDIEIIIKENRTK